MTLADKRSVKPRVSLPRRHEATSRGRGNLRRVLLGRSVGQQAERRRSIRMVADSALIEDDWRDVAGKRDRRRHLGGRKMPDAEYADTDERHRELPACHRAIMQSAGGSGINP